MSNFWEARRSDIEVMKDTVGMGRASEAAVEGKRAAIGDDEIREERALRASHLHGGVIVI